jgi:hypothetical protein
MSTHYKKYVPIIIVIISVLAIIAISAYYIGVKENYFYNKLLKIEIIYY